MKKILYIFWIISGLMATGCSNWLDVKPDNEQVTDDYWQSMKDVEAVVASGYYYMRESTPYLLDWGELRGCSVYTPFINDQDKIQSFQLTATAKSCKWETFYKVINMANSLIDYAPGVRDIDPTYSQEALNSHLAEAYFMRSWAYFCLVRNFKEVPLILTAYVDDSTPYDVAKSTGSEIIARIREDITTALALDGVKEKYEKDWETKGRATTWALYALMADVCLWAEDYDNSIIYCDKILESRSAFRPVFMSISSQWFEMFYPGNSNESVFELNWDGTTYVQTSKSPSNYFSLSDVSTYLYTPAMLMRLVSETSGVGENNAVRSLYGAYVGDVDPYLAATAGWVWKYQGVGYPNRESVRAKKDANLIIYRVADVMLMKAEALIMKGSGSWQDALDLMNKVRNRSNLNNLNVTLAETDELGMLELLLNERDIELAAEGKRWYDLVRFGKLNNYRYKNEFIEIIVENNITASESWLRSVLKNEYAWYLPIFEEELLSNSLLVQNPYYAVTK